MYILCFKEEIYTQKDGVAMGSSLGPVIANIFMSHLEESIVPTLSQKIKFWIKKII